MKAFILNHAPVHFQSAAISLYNAHLWQGRRRGRYLKGRAAYSDYLNWSRDQIAAEQERKLQEFLSFVTQKSPWYSGHDPKKGLSAFPILEKHDLVASFDKIRTLDEREGVVSYTGGTTGASLKVIYSKEDMQERFAALDWFRSLYGWELGARTAWFSGKSLVRERDVKRGYCYRDDWIDNIRFFSTFHINEGSFDQYWKALTEFAPDFMVGFPSSVMEICEFARKKGLIYKGGIKAFFPTAETVLPVHREVIGSVLGCTLRDQYASSEGAPFIFECPCGRKHLHPLTGVFEVVDENHQPCNEGELLVTSFTTHGTPLVRYRVGDRVTLDARHADCDCGWPFPVVESIDGRTADFVWSPINGRINLGNLSNSTKGVDGIMAFQVLQNVPHEIEVLVVGGDKFDHSQGMLFVEALRQRTGEYMRIDLKRVDSIPRERSGKFRIVKNALRPEQMNRIDSV